MPKVSPAEFPSPCFCWGSPLGLGCPALPSAPPDPGSSLCSGMAHKSIAALWVRYYPPCKGLYQKLREKNACVLVFCLLYFLKPFPEQISIEPKVLIFISLVTDIAWRLKHILWSEVIKLGMCFCHTRTGAHFSLDSWNALFFFLLYLSTSYRW